MRYTIQEISDIVEIRQLNALYNRVADEGNGKAFAATFMEDAEFEIAGNRIYRGREEIASACLATKVTVHVTTEPEITLEGDIAHQRLRMISVVNDAHGSRNEFVASGWYIDELKRTSEGWRFNRRTAKLDLSIDKVFDKMGIAEAFSKLAAS